MLVFLDCETTGLDPERHALLEVAAIVTTDTLDEVARFQSVIGYPTGPDGKRVEFHETDEFVRNMHTANGLWADIRKAFGCTDYRTVDDVDVKLAGLIRTHCVRVVTDDKGRRTVERPQLAGSTISFDRAFMKKYLPRAEAELHHRNLDVSSLNELARRFWPEVHKTRPNNPNVAHRAMADVEESLRVAKYYAKTLGGVKIGIQSRTHDADLSEHVLESGFEHVVLPTTWASSESDRPAPRMTSAVADAKPFGCPSDCRAPNCGGGCSQ